MVKTEELWDCDLEKKKLKVVYTSSRGVFRLQRLAGSKGGSERQKEDGKIQTSF